MASVPVHWEGQAHGENLSETDDPREVTCEICRTMMILGGIEIMAMERRPRSMQEAYAALRPGERLILVRRAMRRRAHV